MHADLDRMSKNFQRYKVLDLRRLHALFPERSTRSLFRDLSNIDSMTSFTHAGKYYTLPKITKFDEEGLWFHRNIGFSRAGTLKNTAVEQVERSREGRTANQLSNQLRIRVYNALQDLHRQGRIGREKYRRVYLYVSADPARGAMQAAARRELDASIVEMLRVATDEEVVEILVEALRVAPEVANPEIVSQRLAARGFNLEPHHVLQVYERYALKPGKKTTRDIW